MHPASHSKDTPIAAILIALSLGLITGCSHKHTGAPVVTSSGRLIDQSWITATQSCWPDLAKQGYNADDIRRNLANLDDFHNAYPVYAAQTHKDVDDILGTPLQTGPDPDITQLAHSQYPVLTRGQADAGTVPQMAVVQSTSASLHPTHSVPSSPASPRASANRSARCD